MKKLETLTKEQEALIPIVRQEWLDLFFKNKGNLDKELFEQQIEWLYKRINLPKPFIWYCDSPMMCQLIINFLKQYPNIRDNIGANIGANIGDNIGANIGANIGDNIGDNIGANIWANIWDNIGANIGDNIWANIGDNIGDNIWANIGANIRANIRDNIGANIWANIWANIGANIRANIRDNIRDNIGANIGDNIRANIWANIGDNIGDNIWANIGANIWDNIRDNKLIYESFSSYGNTSDYGWVAFYDYLRRLDYFKFNWDDFMGFQKLLKSGVYDFVAFKNILFVSSCPIEIHQDNNNRLHNINGPSVVFKDGYSVYAIHGRILPSWIWEKRNIIKKEDFVLAKTVEIRAGIYAVLGEKKIMELMGCVEIDKQLIQHANDEIEIIKLFRTVEIFGEIGNNHLAWVKFICPSTGTEYLIACEPHHTNAKEAAASLSIFKTNEYSFNYRT